jgi:hypothetical protein
MGALRRVECCRRFIGAVLVVVVVVIIAVADVALSMYTGAVIDLLIICR